MMYNALIEYELKKPTQLSSYTYTKITLRCAGQFRNVIYNLTRGVKYENKRDRFYRCLCSLCPLKAAADILFFIFNFYLLLC